MKILKWLSLIAFIGAVIVFAASFLVYSSFASRAQMIQRINYNEANAELLGEPGDLIGSPTLMIIEDPKAFVKGKAPEGAKLVDDNYLKAKKIYPLQLKTVGFVTYWARLVSGAVAVAGLIVFLLLRKK